jgi:DNA-binding response OmpR family regulator
MASRPRIVIASPQAAECALLAEWLVADGYEPVRACSVERTAEELKARGFDLLLADESFAFQHGIHVLARGYNPRAPLIAMGPANAAAEAQAMRRGAMYVARPVDRAMLTCSVSMALMESRPVRRSARKRVIALDAVVDGVQSRIIDVSTEGMRLEVPRGRTSTLPPFFSVRVGMLGINVMVRRMWTSATPDARRDVAWYGSELARNALRIEQTWRTLVDALPATSAVQVR